MADDQDTRKLLEATETLLSNIREQREALDRRERDLLEDRARYQARLGAPVATVIQLPQRSAAPVDNEQEYESIREAVRTILEEAHGKKLRVSDLANELERRDVKTEAKEYATAARNALRYWQKKKSYVKQQPVGYYRWIGPFRGAELLASGGK